MRLAGSTPGELAHICACFKISEDAYRVLQPFVNEGLDRAEKAVRTIDLRRRAEHLRQPTWPEILLFLATILLLAETLRYSQWRDREPLVGLLLALGFVQLKLLPSLAPRAQT